MYSRISHQRQVGRPEIVPYGGVFPYFASSLFTNGHFGHSGAVPYFASFPYFAVPYCKRLLYCQTSVGNVTLQFGGNLTVIICSVTQKWLVGYQTFLGL